MLKFLVFEDGRLAAGYPVRNAYLLGAGNHPMRGRVWFESGTIVCEKREHGSAALALQQRVGGCGELTIQTCLLPDREEPYLLGVELARHRLMVLYAKLEDWALFDLPRENPVMRGIEAARRLFIDALCRQRQDPPEADRVARQCLVAAIHSSEELALLHAESMLARRKAAGTLPRRPIGCGVALEQESPKFRAALLANFDFLGLPMPWRKLAPEPGRYQWGLLDGWAEWITRHRVPVVAGPVISFDPRLAPEWLSHGRHHFDKLRDSVYEHTETVVTRYRNVVTAWNVVSGLHLNHHFNLNFEQILELTRMCTMLVKKIQPVAKVLVEIREPFGEYYSFHQRSIPPLIYADLVVQSAANFDGFVIRFLMGRATPGQSTRDLMQVSGLLDQFLALGKPVHVVAAAPSLVLPDEAAAPSMRMFEPGAGYWRRPWSPLVQSRWAEAMFQVAISKPQVESVAWGEVVDDPDSEVPSSGLLTTNLEVKNSFRRIRALRHRLLGAEESRVLAVTPEGPPAGEGAGEQAPKS